MKQKPEIIQMIEKIIIHYVKFNYHDHLKKNNLSKIQDSDLQHFIDEMYNSKKQNLSKYIRECLKESLGNEYPSLVVNNIILEIFDDDELAKNKVILEIQNYQDTLVTDPPKTDTLKYSLD